MAAAIKVAEKAPKGVACFLVYYFFIMFFFLLVFSLPHALGSNILCILPDTGERYLSTLLFKDITEDSDVI
jgi:cysteine synthase